MKVFKKDGTLTKVANEEKEKILKKLKHEKQIKIYTHKSSHYKRFYNESDNHLFYEELANHLGLNYHFGNDGKRQGKAHDYIMIYGK